MYFFKIINNDYTIKLRKRGEKRSGTADNPHWKSPLYYAMERNISLIGV